MLYLPKSETLSLLESIYGLWHFLLFILLGKGLMGASSTPKSVFVGTGTLNKETMQVDTPEDGFDASNPANIPDTEIMVHPVNSMWKPLPGHSLLSFYTTLVQPKSVGSVELVDADPRSNPRVHHPVFKEAEDMKTFRSSIRFTMRLAEEFLKSGYPQPASIAFAPGANTKLMAELKKDSDAPGGTTGPEGPPPAPGLPFSSKGAEDMPVSHTARLEENKTWKTVSDDEIDDHVRRFSTGALHVSCTCPMSSNEKSGVVDQHLRVHGFKNLRIADASVFPKIPSGHTMAPTMMVSISSTNPALASPRLENIQPGPKVI
jgi:choline dehydrogenase-like flavoprotein